MIRNLHPTLNAVVAEYGDAADAVVVVIIDSDVSTISIDVAAPK